MRGRPVWVPPGLHTRTLHPRRRLRPGCTTCCLAATSCHELLQAPAQHSELCDPSSSSCHIPLITVTTQEALLDHLSGNLLPSDPCYFRQSTPLSETALLPSRCSLAFLSRSPAQGPGLTLMCVSYLERDLAQNVVQPRVLSTRQHPRAMPALLLRGLLVVL